MNYTIEEVLQYVREEDVKFIRLAFCDVTGRQKNISVMPGQLERAFRTGISIDGSAIAGFAAGPTSDLFLFPDPATLTVLPWRPDHGKVVRMFCAVRRPDGGDFEADTRTLLRKTAEKAQRAGWRFRFGAEYEFYLFCTDENGNPTQIPYDRAGYMDIAPEDRGENVRREICLTLEQMGISPEGSHHEEGPGQNEIDFRCSDPLGAADDAVTFLSVVRTIAARSGLFADFSPKPISGQPGNGLHINFSVVGPDGVDRTDAAAAGILTHIGELTAFLNPREDSYRRLGGRKAPKYVSWSAQNRSQLIRVPAAPSEEFRRAELRSPDPCANPYLALALLLEAAMDGLDRGLTLPEPVQADLSTANPEQLRALATLPATLFDARRQAAAGGFVKGLLPAPLFAALLEQ